MDRFCEQCGTHLKHSTRPRRFCNRTCFAKWKLNRDVFGVPLAITINNRKCLVCDHTFRPTPDQVRHGFGNYCSQACNGTAKTGKAPTPRDPTIQTTFRMSWYLANGWKTLSQEYRDANSCKTCGSSEALEVHHKVDPFPTRDVYLLLAPENLEVRCKRCHLKEHNPPKIRPMLTCKQCGKNFPQKGKTPDPHCSMVCRRKQPQLCIICAAPFIGTHKTAKCCSSKCAAKLTAQVKTAKRPAFVCCVCQKTFTMFPSQAARGIKDPSCSKACAHKKRQLAVAVSEA